MTQANTTLAVVVAIILLSSIGVVPAAAGHANGAPSVAQVNNETSTPTAAAGQCNPSDPPKLSTARLFTREDTIATGQPGTIAGGFLPPAGLQCDMVVRISMQVPNNIRIQGTKRLGSGGAGIVASEFTIPAGASSVKSVRANVYASETGKLAVTADIQYWPKGYPDLKRTISGLTLNFNVNEPNTAPSPTPTPTPEGGTPVPPNPPGSGIPLSPLQIAIIGLTLVGIASAATVRRIYINS